MTELTQKRKKQYKNYDQQELSDAFIDACLDGHLDIISHLLTSPELKEHADIHAMDDLGFQWACQYGHLEIVKYLLTSPELTQHTDIHTIDDIGFQMACKEGHLDIVRYLLTSPDLKEHADIHALNDDGFQSACENTQFDVVVYLLSLNGKHRIDFQCTECNLDWALANKYDNVIVAMMKNLKNNNPFHYFECLPKIEIYNKELYEQIKNIEIEILEINSSVPELFV